MKRFIFFLLSVSCFFESKIVSYPRFNAPDLGKTHFIVGLPPQNQIQKINDKECEYDNLSNVLRCKDGGFKQAFFSPDDDLQQLLVQLINNEQESIKAAVFSFTDGAIAAALINAYKRGVQVEIVTDISSIRDKFNKIELLKKHGITIHVYNPRNVTILNNIMHHKFIVFGKNVGGKSLLWTGSFNFTKSATLNNQENVLVLDEMHLIDRYHTQFSLLKERIQSKAAVPKLAHRKNKKWATA